MAVVHLIRHGESLWNRQRRVQGATPQIGLTELGRAQAAQVAADLEPVEELWTSDLRRARQTADVIAAHCGLEARVHPELREQGLGILEGLPFAEALRLADTVDWSDPDARVPQGESLREVYQRLVRVFGPVTERPTARLAVVSHGDTIRVAIAVLSGWPVEAVPRAGVANGSITTIDVVTPAQR